MSAPAALIKACIHIPKKDLLLYKRLCVEVAVPLYAETGIEGRQETGQRRFNYSQNQCKKM